MFNACSSSSAVFHRVPAHRLSGRAEVYCHPQGGCHSGVVCSRRCTSLQQCAKSNTDRDGREPQFPSCKRQTEGSHLPWVKEQSSGRNQPCPFALNPAHVRPRAQREGLRDNTTQQPVWTAMKKNTSLHPIPTAVSKNKMGKDPDKIQVQFQYHVASFHTELYVLSNPHCKTVNFQPKGNKRNWYFSSCFTIAGVGMPSDEKHLSALPFEVTNCSCTHTFPPSSISQSLWWFLITKSCLC